MRDGCQACTTDCYRDASVMLHFPVAIGDAFARLSEGRLASAAAALADRRNVASLGAVIEHGSRVVRLAGRRLTGVPDGQWAGRCTKTKAG